MKAALALLRTEPRRAGQILLLDVLFYLSLATIPSWAFSSLQRQVTSVPFSIAAQQSAPEFQGTLTTILVSLLGTIFLVIFGVLLTYSLLKLLVWLRTLGKPFTAKLWWRSLALTALLFALGIVPAIITRSMITISVLETPPLSAYILPFLLWALLLTLGALSMRFLSAEGSLRKAIAKTFTVGMGRFGLAFLVAAVHLAGMLVSLNLPFPLYSFALVSTVLGFFGRGIILSSS